MWQKYNGYMYVVQTEKPWAAVAEEHKADLQFRPVLAEIDFS